MIGARFESNGKLLTITGEYEDRYDPPGYYYQYDGEKAVHWISTKGMVVRFKSIGGENARPT